MFRNCRRMKLPLLHIQIRIEHGIVQIMFDCTYSCMIPMIDKCLFQIRSVRKKLYFFSDKCIEGIWAIMQHSLRLNQYTFCDNDVNEYQISIGPPHGSYICNRMPHLFCLSAHIRSSHTTSLSKSTQNFLKLTLTRGWCIIIWIAGYQCATMQWSTQNKLNFRYPFFDS